MDSRVRYKPSSLPFRQAICAGPWRRTQAVIRSKMFRHSLQHHDIGQSSDHLRIRPAAFRADQQALARGLVDQVEDAHTTTIVRSRTHEVVAPHVARMRRSEPHTRAIVEPQPSSWLLPLRNLQPFTTPDALYPVLTHLPAGPLQQRRDPAIAVASVLTGQL